MIRAILACDEEWGIGKNGDLPWPTNMKDLQWFKRNTLNNAIVMGRKTWDSLPVKPLPKRKNIVVSRSLKAANGVEVVSPDILNSRLNVLSQEMPVWIIGGAQLLENSLSILDEIWLSRISGTHECDTYLPKAVIELSYELYNSEQEHGVYVEKWRKI